MTDWERLEPDAVDAFAALSAMVESAWAETDPVLLELVRLRIATLLDNPAELARRSSRAEAAGLGEAMRGDVAHWATSNHFGDRERACLALAEQFVLDANGVTDSGVSAVVDQLGPAGCFGFVESVSVLETFQRACLTLGVTTYPGPVERPGVPATTATEVPA